MFKASEATLALVHREVTEFNAKLKQTHQNHGRGFLLTRCPKEIPQKESNPIENVMQAFSNDFSIFVYLMAHTEALLRGISKEVLGQDCSYRREAIIPSLLSKAQQF